MRYKCFKSLQTFSAAEISVENGNTVAHNALHKLQLLESKVQRGIYDAAVNPVQTPVKFQMDWLKTVGGVARTRYLLSCIHLCSIVA